MIPFLGHTGKANLQVIALHDLNFSITIKRRQKRGIIEARKIRKEKQEIEERYLKRVHRIYEYLNFVHPSEDVIFAQWYPLPDPIWVPKLLADEKRNLILDLNGLLVKVVETKHDGHIAPVYTGKMTKYCMQDGRYVLYRKDSHSFLD